VDHDEVIAAFAAGDDVKQMERRFGVSEEDILKIIEAETEDRAGPALNSIASGRQRPSPVRAAGVLLIVLGLVGPFAMGALWLAVFYLSGGDYPAQSWRYWNLVAGASGICAGSILTVTGLILLLVARAKR
jgi:hypothetical protein